MKWDPSRPVPDDSGPHHTHRAATIEVSAARAAPGNDVPVGEWRILVRLTATSAVEAGHVLAAVLEPARARAIAASLIQAAGDVESGRTEDRAREAGQ